jgi:DNA polymerase-3 subunit chi
MTEISFYHLTVRPLEWALPKLLERTLESGVRALVVVSSEARVEELNAHLWTYGANAWLPHGAEKDDNAADQPIWLNATGKNANAADFLFLADGAVNDHVEDFTRVFELFDGRDGEAVAAARERWKVYRAAGHDLSYWQQDERGRWSKAA